MKKISYSAWKKYITCPKMYDFHYNHRLRPTGTSSPLVFGIAVDEALNALLLTQADPVKVFQEHFKWEDMVGVEWRPDDFDHRIFNEEQLQKIAGEPWEYKAWASMRIKGRLLLEAYKERIYPLIEKVHEVQKDIKGGPGVLDAIVDIKGYGTVLLDHKTSGRPYERDSVARSTQLALYAKREGITQAGFVVLVKNINKDVKKTCIKCSFDGSGRQHKTCFNEIKGVRCNGAWVEQVTIKPIIQLIVDDVPARNMQLIEESIKDTEHNIEHGKFNRNLEACHKMYGKPCKYYDLCWNGKKTGLKYEPKK